MSFVGSSTTKHLIFQEETTSRLIEANRKSAPNLDFIAGLFGREPNNFLEKYCIPVSYPSDIIVYHSSPTLTEDCRFFVVARVYPNARNLKNLVMFKPFDERGNGPVHVLEEKHAEEEIRKLILQCQIYSSHMRVNMPDGYILPSLDLEG
jgi:hypothetical protein